MSDLKFNILQKPIYDVIVALYTGELVILSSQMYEIPIRSALERKIADLKVYSFFSEIHDIFNLSTVFSIQDLCSECYN